MGTTTWRRGMRRDSRRAASALRRRRRRAAAVAEAGRRRLRWLLSAPRRRLRRATTPTMLRSPPATVDSPLRVRREPPHTATSPARSTPPPPPPLRRDRPEAYLPRAAALQPHLGRRRRQSAHSRLQGHLRPTEWTSIRRARRSPAHREWPTSGSVPCPTASAGPTALLSLPAMRHRRWGPGARRSSTTRTTCTPVRWRRSALRGGRWPSTRALPRSVSRTGSTSSRHRRRSRRRRRHRRPSRRVVPTPRPLRPPRPPPPRHRRRRRRPRRSTVRTGRSRRAAGDRRAASRDGKPRVATTTRVNESSRAEIGSSSSSLVSASHDARYKYRSVYIVFLRRRRLRQRPHVRRFAGMSPPAGRRFDGGNNRPLRRPTSDLLLAGRRLTAAKSPDRAVARSPPLRVTPGCGRPLVHQSGPHLVWIPFPTTCFPRERLRPWEVFLRPRARH